MRPRSRCSAGSCSTGAGVCSIRLSAAGVNRSSAVPTWPAAVATPGPSAARAARSRRSLNDPMHTRSVALCRNTSATVGARASSALMSMLIRVSGNCSKRSDSSGIGSAPPIRASRTAS